MGDAELSNMVGAVAAPTKSQGGWDDEDDDDAAAAPSVDGTAELQLVLASGHSGAREHILCETCTASSRDVPWYDDRKAFCKDSGTLIDVPVGDACLSCGRATEAYPHMTREQVVHSVKHDKAFGIGFRATKLLADKLPPEPDFSVASVETKFQCGMRVETEVGCQAWCSRAPT